MLNIGIVSAQADNKHRRHCQQQIYTHLLVLLLHEVGLARKKVELTNLKLQRFVLTVVLVQALERLHHLGLQRCYLAYLKIVDNKHKGNHQHKYACYGGYRLVNIFFHRYIFSNSALS